MHFFFLADSAERCFLCFLHFFLTGVTDVRGVTGQGPLGSGIGPARSLAVHSIFGPELIRHCRWTGLVPDLIGPTDGVRVLSDIAYSRSPAVLRASCVS
jgi:hypothetical protein